MTFEVIDRTYSPTTKSTARAAAMARTWAARREWAANPVCCCGCGAKLAVGKDPEHQRLFCQGHDGRLHKLLRQVLRGEASRQDIPLEARTNLAVAWRNPRALFALSAISAGL